jgi:hypothetical protein
VQYVHPSNTENCKPQKVFAGIAWLDAYVT